MNTSEKIEQVSASLFAVQRDVELPRKDAKGQVKGRADYRYLSLPALIDHLKPLLKGAQLFVTQDVAGGPGFVEVTTTVWHFSGQFLAFGPTFMPAPGDAQAVGSAITYARRYALAAVFNLAADDDDDAQGSAGRVGKAPAEAGAAGSQRAPAAPAVPVATVLAEDDGRPATDEQWARLVAACGGSMAKARNRLNKATHKNYTTDNMREQATFVEVALAITGGSE